MSKKIEELVENIYRKVDEAQADSVIENIDKKAEALSFFKNIEKQVGQSILVEADIDKLMKISINQAWYNWMANWPSFEMSHDVTTSKDGKCSILWHSGTGRIVALISGDLSNKDKRENEEYRNKFDSFKTFNKDERQKILENFALPF